MDEADNTETESTTENQDSYTVVLNSEPTNNVQITLTAPDMVTLSASSLTFTSSNWDQAQTVTATAVDDTVDNPGNERTGDITHVVVAGSSDYGGVTVDRVAVTVNDNDTAPDGITLSVTPEEICRERRQDPHRCNRYGEWQHPLCGCQDCDYNGGRFR